ncbi:MAG TPA: 7TM-DISM domain-containing protein, partial [Candidatus Aminicenantes bacterium]|nr:7TM-DISM domain-containing protein [Candidatus Aminicenantes bacterium]
MAAPEASGHFIAQRTFAPALGFSRSPVWLRITVHNPAPAFSEALLEVAYPHLDELELYSAGLAGKWTSQRTGDHFPFAQRPVPGRMFAFPLRLPPGDTVLYLRCRTTSAASFPLRLETPAGYAAREKRELNQIWFLFGMMVMLLVYNLFILLSVREMSILFLMLFIIDYLLFLLTHNGMAFQYIWPAHPAWNEVAMPFFIFLGSFFGCLFTGAFCRVLPTPSPAQRWITGETISLAIGSAVCPFFLSYRLAMPLAIGAISLFLVTLLLTGLFELQRGNRSARYLLLAIFLFTVGVALFVGTTLGVLPDTFLTTWSIQVA